MPLFHSVQGLIVKFVDSPYYSDGLFFEVPPLASNALLTMLHPHLKNVLQTVCCKLQEGSGTGGFDLLIWLEKPRNHMRQDLDCMVDVQKGIMAVPIRTFSLCDF
jgi:hypothetical protein